MKFIQGFIRTLNDRKITMESCNHWKYTQDKDSSGLDIEICNYFDPLGKEVVAQKIFNKEGKFLKYTGYVKCSECNCNLYRRTKIKHGKEKYFYYCSSYVKNRTCNKHYIQEKELDKIVLESINKYIELVCNVGNTIDNVNNDY